MSLAKKKQQFYKTGVVYDPLDQPKARSAVNICFVSFYFKKWRRTDRRTDGQQVWKQWSVLCVTCVGRPSGSKYITVR